MNADAAGYAKEGATLTEAHLALIRASAIGKEVARERGYRTESIKARLREKGFNAGQCRHGLLSPMFNARGDCVNYQLRPNEPRLGHDGKPIKYETPYKSRVVIDIHPRLSRPRKIDQQTPFDPPELLPMIMDVSVPLIITEGARKADSAVSRGLCAIALMGVSAWHRLPDWNDFPIKERTIYVCFDSDAMQKRPVWIQLRDLKVWLETHGAKVFVIYLPPGPHGAKVGLDDFIAALVTQVISDDEVRARLLALATDELRPAPGADEKNKTAEGRRPAIFVDRAQLRDKVAEALTALGKANDPPLLFCRGGMLTRLRDDGDSIELEALDDAALLSELSEAANFYRHSRNDEAVDADPPANVARALRGSRRFPFPHIDAVVRAPFFTPDGSLITTSGYHADARVYVALDSALAAQLDAQLLPEQPTPEDVTWARALLLDELFCNFPFEDAASKAHAVALTLLPFVRKMIDGPTPNHAVMAPAQGEGTGKGLLVQAACAPGLGEIATIPETRDNDELALKVSAKSANEVGKVGGTVETAEKSAETKENFPANPAQERPISSDEVGALKMLNFTKESGNRPTPPTFTPDSTAEDGLELYPDEDAMEDEERDS